MGQAQDLFLEEWAAAASNNPADVQFQIRLPEGKSSWRIGEIIPLTLEFRSTSSGKWSASSRTYDRSGRLNGVEEFHLDPAGGVGDPFENGPGFTRFGGGVSGGPRVLSTEPIEIVREINEWVRFQRPGSYRLYVATRRVFRNAEPDDDEERSRRHTPVDPIEIVSNVVNFDITEASAGWANEQVREALKVLDDPQSGDVDQAARVLRFLETPEAAETMARRLSDFPHGSSPFRLGILSSPHRAQVLPVMDELLTSSRQPVTRHFVETLTSLFFLVNRPLQAPFPSEDPSQEEAWRSELRSRWEERNRKLDGYYARLARSVASKEPHAAAVSRKTLLEYAWSRQRNAAPAWLDSVVARLRERFLSLSEELQRDLLDYHWPQLAGPEMVPALKRCYDQPSTVRRDPSIHDLVLRRLYEISPDDGRELVIEQIRHGTKRIEWKTLAMLSDVTLPKLNDELATRLEAGESVGGLIVRYADGEIVDHVKAAFEKRRVKDQESKHRRYRQSDCITHLHFYFLRYAPEYAAADLDRIFAAEGSPYPACRDLSWRTRELGDSVRSPALEEIAIKYVNGHGSVTVKKGAAEVLGRYGSTAAEEPLWEAMAYFHEWWKGRKEELEGSAGDGGPHLEQAYRTALARADGWVLDAKGLNRLRDLCTTDWCRGEVGEWLRRAQSPLLIDLSMGGSGRVSAQVAQYHLRNEAALLRKLKQFPAGTKFRWEHRPGAGAFQKARDIRDRVEEIIRSRGGSIVP